MWRDPINWLVVIVGVVAVADFLLTEPEHEKVRGFFETLWIRLDDLKVSQIGMAEAIYCLRIFDKIFSPKIFSLKRWVSAALLLAIFDFIYYVAVECTRALDGMPVRPPFIGSHFNTGYPFPVIACVISLSLTRSILYLSVKFCAALKYSTVWFVLAIFLTALISENFFDLALIPAAYIKNVVEASYVFMKDFVINRHFPPTLFKDEMGNGVPFGAALLNAYDEELRIITEFIKHPIPHHLGIYNSYGIVVKIGAVDENLEGMYFQWVKLNVTLLRLWFAVGFLVLWIVVRPIYKLVWRLLLRLTDRTQRGPIACTAFILWILVKLIELAAVGH